MASSVLSRSSKDHWNAGQYLHHQEARTRPGVDLLQRALFLSQQSGLSLSSVVDVGTGTGRFLPFIADFFPQIPAIKAFDNSKNMVDAAQTFLDQEKSKRSKPLPPIELQVKSVEEFVQSKEKTDFLFSNAVLQWLPNHNQLFPELVKNNLNEKGIFAIQMPNNFQEPSHVQMRKTLVELEQKSLISTEALKKIEEQLPQTAQQGPSSYYSALEPSFAFLDIWETIYYQKLEVEVSSPSSSPSSLSAHPSFLHPVCDWLLGSALGPVLAALSSQELKTTFLSSYSQKLNPLYLVTQKPLANGNIQKSCFFPFKRIFIVGIKK